MSDDLLATGGPAPAVKLPRETGETVSFDDFAGTAIVLFFYPRADTSGCTKEAVAFTEHLGAFEAANTVVIGVSKDPVAKQAKFRDKHSLGMPLLSDEEGDVCERYGVWVEKSMYGKTYMGIERTTVLLDASHKIAQVWRKVKVPGHADAVLEAAQSL